MYKIDTATNTTFAVNENYLMNWISSSSSKLRWKVTKRTKATITIESQNGQIEKRRIKKDKKNNEYVEPFGRYSMSPMLWAKNQITL